MKELMIFLARDFYLIVAAAMLLYLAIRYYKAWQEVGIAILFIGVVAYGLSLIATQIISDPRPFIQDKLIIPLVESATDNGFPSDHTLFIATLGVILFVKDRLAGILVLCAALLIGLARVYCQVHHVLDIIGSIIIAGLALGIYWGLRQLFERSKFFQRFANPPKLENSAIKSEK